MFKKLLSVSTKMSERERDIIMPRMIQGFKDLAQHAGTSINGGQTVFNPWLIIGTYIFNSRQPGIT